MADNKKGSCVALGYFDGLHKGHCRVLETALEKARKMDLTAVVLLFDVHPKKLLQGKAPALLISDSMKRKRLEEMGFRVEDFDFRQAMNYSAREFCSRVLEEKLGARAICCGYDFRYGKNGSGNGETLKEYFSGTGVQVEVIPAVSSDGEAISSSRVRGLILQGEIEKANRLLAEPFGYELEVRRGDGVGHTLGFPTINQYFPEDFIVARHGVYASQVTVEGKTYPAVTNIGVRPTVGGGTVRSESCIIGFEGDLYSKHIGVKLLKYIREEKRFSSLERLKEQIQRDKKTALSIFEEEKMAMDGIKAVFFDFDDTLQSRKGAYRLYCNEFLDKYFPHIDAVEKERKLDEMEELVDGGYKDREVYFPELIELWNWQEHPDMQELYDSFNYDFGKHIVLLEGALDILSYIKSKGYVLGCITNGVSSLQNIKLDTAGIRDMFDVVVVSGDIGIYKPARGIFDEACRRAGVSNEQALFVGDHPVNDIQGALGAGMKAIRMNYGDFKGKGLGNPGVTAEIESISELKKYI